MAFEIGYLPLNPNNAQFIQGLFDIRGDVVYRINFALREEIHGS
jgi:chemotaxis signal transduction protein